MESWAMDLSSLASIYGCHSWQLYTRLYAGINKDRDKWPFMSTIEAIDVGPFHTNLHHNVFV
jgi:hypothetical protein